MVEKQQITSHKIVDEFDESKATNGDASLEETKHQESDWKLDTATKDTAEDTTNEKKENVGMEIRKTEKPLPDKLDKPNDSS